VTAKVAVSEWMLIPTGPGGILGVMLHQDDPRLAGWRKQLSEALSAVIVESWFREVMERGNR
jgi:hypothetical protein